MKPTYIEETHVKSGTSPAEKANYLSWIDPASIWAAIVVSLIAYTGQTPLAQFALYLFLGWVLWKRQLFKQKLITLVIFLSIGLHTTYRFDTDKVLDWALNMILPMALITLLIYYSALLARIGKILVTSVRGLVYIIQLHWWPLSVSTACLIALMFKDLLAGWAGFIVILLIILMEKEHISRPIWIYSSFVMVGHYILLVVMLYWKGVIWIVTDPLPFLLTYTDRMVIPFLLLLFVVLVKEAQKS